MMARELQCQQVRGAVVLVDHDDRPLVSIRVKHAPGSTCAGAQTRSHSCGDGSCTELGRSFVHLSFRADAGWKADMSPPHRRDLLVPIPYSKAAMRLPVYVFVPSVRDAIAASLSLNWNAAPPAQSW